MDRAAWLAVAASNALIALVAQMLAGLVLVEEGRAEAARLVEAGADFQMVHALATLGLCSLGWPRDNIAWLFLYATLFFSGGLYLRAAGLPTLVLVLAAIGGVLAAAGWITLAVAAYGRRWQ